MDSPKLRDAHDTRRPNAPELGAVISAYLEESSIEEFHRRLSDTLASLGRSYEIVYVNDGSADATWDKLESLFAADDHVSAVLDLTANSGKEAALTAATECARAAKLIYIDGDLQLDPEDIPRALAAFDEGADVVSGYRRRRSDSPWRALSSRAANALWRRVWGTRLRDLGCHFWVIDGALMRRCGFGAEQPIRLSEILRRAERCAEVPVSHHPRPHGRSSWTALRLARYFVDGVLGARATAAAPSPRRTPAYVVRTVHRR